jgi:nucleotide-binding universal stress UspA family protein
MNEIVVGLDESTGSQQALEWALAEAKDHQDPVRLIHVIPAPQIFYPYPMGAIEQVQLATDEAKSSVREMLAGALDKAGGAPEGVTVEIEALAGAPATALVDASADARMLVVGSRGRGGFAGLLLGSVSQQVVQHARCPVVVIPEM